MGKTTFLFLLLTLLECAFAWNNLNCPAPRAPENGLSFVFDDGAIIQFVCHPGYKMRGKARVHCVNNTWTHSPPRCLPIKRGKRPFNEPINNDMHQVKDNEVIYDPVMQKRPLFNWNDKKGKGVYGDGPRRLPLINGIWPPQDQADQVLALGPQSTPGPRTMVKEEIDIAELRQKQLEELKYKRHRNKGKRRNGHRRRNRHQKHGLRLNNSEAGEKVLAIGSKPENITTDASKSLKKRRHRNPRNRTRSFAPNEFVTSRKSRVEMGYSSPGGLTELRRRPTQELSFDEFYHMSLYDSTCVEQASGKKVPSLSPNIENAFVYSYETKKIAPLPYMVAKYRCKAGYHLAKPGNYMLFCQKQKWVGERPQCIAD